MGFPATIDDEADLRLIRESLKVGTLADDDRFDATYLDAGLNRGPQCGVVPQRDRRGVRRQERPVRPQGEREARHDGRGSHIPDVHLQCHEVGLGTGVRGQVELRGMKGRRHGEAGDGVDAILPDPARPGRRTLARHGLQGWAFADQALRVAAGVKPLPDIGVKDRLFAKDNINSIDLNAQESTWYGHDDYAAQYKKLWGVK